MKLLKQLFLGLLSVSFIGGLAFALTCSDGGTPVERFTVNDSEIYCIDASGNQSSSGSFTTQGRIHTSSETISLGLKLGSSNQTTPSAPSAGASGTGFNFGLQVPYVNATAGTISRGMIVTSTITATSVIAPGTITTAMSTNTWLGIASHDLASGGTGYMTVSGYALCLTTETVSIGDLIVTTTTVGYGRGVTASSVTFNGSVVGRARSVGTAAGGLTLIQIGD